MKIEKSNETVRMLAASIDQSLINVLRRHPTLGTALRYNPVKQIRETSIVADGSAIYEIGNMFIIFVAPKSFPDVAADEARIIKSVKGALPPQLSAFLMDAIEGRLEDNRSFIVLPRGTPLSSNKLKYAWQRLTVIPSILNWLRGMASQAAPPSPETTADFKSALESLVAFGGIADEIKESAKTSLDRLLAGLFIPQHCPMHCDLWRGNIIYGPDGSLKIIDWGASRLSGYGVFDLVKFCSSMEVAPRLFRRELAFHSRALGIHDMTDALGTMLATCGNICRTLNEFPGDRLVVLTTELFDFFNRSTGDVR